jgi:hypothetical protein
MSQKLEHVVCLAVVFKQSEWILGQVHHKLVVVGEGLQQLVRLLGRVLQQLFKELSPFAWLTGIGRHKRFEEGAQVVVLLARNFAF